MMARHPTTRNIPLVVYRSPVALDPKFDPAAMFESRCLSGTNGGDSWRAKMYGYNHFHTGTHECLGIARGKVTAQFGGASGRKIELRAGDVVIIPAGVGHKHIKQSKDLLIVGAYPANAGKYDEPKPGEIDHAVALKNVERAKRPATDPVYGRRGPLFIRLAEITLDSNIPRAKRLLKTIMDAKPRCTAIFIGRVPMRSLSNAKPVRLTLARKIKGYRLQGPVW